MQPQQQPPQMQQKSELIQTSLIQTAGNDAAPSTRTSLRPVRFHYADSFWCTYIVSVVSANIAELGELPAMRWHHQLNRADDVILIDLYCLLQPRIHWI